MESLELLLYGKSDCHLCKVAEAALQRLSRRQKVTYRYVDINSEAALIQQFGDRIPVVTLPDGTVLCEGKVSERRLRESLRKYAQSV